MAEGFASEIAAVEMMADVQHLAHRPIGSDDDDRRNNQ